MCAGRAYSACALDFPARSHHTVVDFTLTDEQKDIRELAHTFAEKEMRPVAWEYDKDGTWPKDVIEKAWETGLMNTHVPEEYGGPGLGYLEGTWVFIRPVSQAFSMTS